MADLPGALQIVTSFGSFLALLLTVWEGIQSRRHNRLSLKPILSIEIYTVPIGDKMGLYFKNEGMGPAIIRKMSVWVKGTILEIGSHKSFQKAVDDAGFPKGLLRFCVCEPGTTCSPNNSFPVLLVRKDMFGKFSLNDFEEWMKNFQIEIHYESVYGEKFLAKMLDLNGTYDVKDRL